MAAGSHPQERSGGPKKVRFSNFLQTGLRLSWDVQRLSTHLEMTSVASPAPIIRCPPPFCFGQALGVARGGKNIDFLTFLQIVPRVFGAVRDTPTGPQTTPAMLFSTPLSFLFTPASIIFHAGGVGGIQAPSGYVV